MGLFEAAHGCGGGGKKAHFPKSCHTYPTMMNLGTVTPYLKRTQKYINHVAHPLSSAGINIFLSGISNVCYIKKYRYIKKYIDCILVHNFYFLFWVFKDFLTNMVTILMMSVKITTPGLLKTKVFWNKVYDVIISVHCVTNKSLSRGSNFIADVIIWPKFGLVPLAFLW